jgi:hypothetical protein
MMARQKSFDDTSAKLKTDIAQQKEKISQASAERAAKLKVKQASIRQDQIKADKDIDDKHHALDLAINALQAKFGDVV